LSNFYPISPLVGITNTSYAAQAGVMEEKWACRVVRGKKILAEKTIHQLDLESYVGVIYGHIRLEGLSRHAVAQCAGRLMQFSRKYQTAGICPNYEVPDLVYDDGSSPAAASEETSEAKAESVSSIDDVSVTGVGAVPKLEPLEGVGLWQPAIASYGVTLAEVAAYGERLPDGHLDLMFENVANELVRMWSASGEGVDGGSNGLPALSIVSYAACHSPVARRSRVEVVYQTVATGWVVSDGVQVIPIVDLAGRKLAAHHT